MRTIIRPGVGGIFGRTSSVGTLVDGAALAYSADQRPLPVLHGFGAEWAPGQPTPDRATYLAHGYYRGVEAGRECGHSVAAPEWDCNVPNAHIISTYAISVAEQGLIPNAQPLTFIEAVRTGKLSPPPGFPPLVKAANLLQAPAASSNVGLFIGLGVAALALGGAVLAKKKRAA